MFHKPVPTPRELIERYFAISEPPSPELIAAIDRFIKEELGITIFSLTGQWGGAEMWQFSSDINGEIIAEDPPRTKFEVRKEKKSYRLLISRQGPFVTTASYILRLSNPDPWHDCSWAFDEPTDPRAVAWAQAIAQRFNLHYVDIFSLSNWEVERDALPDKGSFLDYSEPTAFNILFYE